MGHFFKILNSLDDMLVLDTYLEFTDRVVVGM